MSGVSVCIKDIQRSLRKLHKASKHVSGCSKRKGTEDPPEGAQVEPDRPGSEMDVPGSVQSGQEHPEGIQNEHSDGMNAPCQDTGPGGCLEV